jgi:hypothetical protein
MANLARLVQVGCLAWPSARAPSLAPVAGFFLFGLLSAQPLLLLAASPWHARSVKTAREQLQHGQSQAYRVALERSGFVAVRFRALTHVPGPWAAASVTSALLLCAAPLAYRVWRKRAAGYETARVGLSQTLVRVDCERVREQARAALAAYGCVRDPVVRVHLDVEAET